MTVATSITWTTLTLDCSEAEPLGAFYARLLGWESPLATGRTGSSSATPKAASD